MIPLVSSHSLLLKDLAKPTSNSTVHRNHLDSLKNNPCPPRQDPTALDFLGGTTQGSPFFKAPTPQAPTDVQPRMRTINVHGPTLPSSVNASY